MVRQIIQQARAAKPRRAPVRPFLNALLEGDGIQAAALAEQALSVSGSRVAIFADLLQPALFEVGELWYSGKLGVAEEHRATAIVASIVDRLPSTPSPAGSRPRRRCLLAAVGEEQHLLGLRLVALTLADDGWEVQHLGTSVPLPELLAFAGRTRPHLVGLSASYLPSVQPLARAIQALKALGAPVLVGGAAFNRMPSLWRRVGAAGHAGDARIAAVLARKVAA
jgi:methanogenic corrinoid protein MtbC1